MVAILVAWLAGALGGLALVPYAALVFIFVAVLILPTLVAFWDSDGLWKRYGQRWRIPMSRAERDRANYISWAILAEIVTKRYRVVWLIVTMVLGLLAATANMLGGFASAVVAVDGQPVHATRLRLERTERLRDPGYDVECVLARPDGRRIPGALPIPDGDTCGETEDVWVDPHGLVDPVRQQDEPGDVLSVQALLLGLALLSCVPAARPRRAPDPYLRPARLPRQQAASGESRRQRSRPRRKRRLRGRTAHTRRAK
jgi:hypothetical protein